MALTFNSNPFVDKTVQPFLDTAGPVLNPAADIGRRFENTQEARKRKEEEAKRRARQFEDPFLRENQDILRQREEEVRARSLDQSRIQEERMRQQQMMDRLAAIATGQQPGAGTLAVNQAQQSANLQQQALAQSGRGVNPILAQRAAQEAIGSQAQQFAGQRQQVGLQEQRTAQDLLAQMADQARGQELGVTDLQLQQQQMKDALIGQFVAQGMDMERAQFMAQQELARIEAGMAADQLMQQRRAQGGFLQAAGAGASLLLPMLFQGGGGGNTP